MSLASLARHAGGGVVMKFELPPLPYAKDALAPHLGAETLEYHYEKHHRGYVEKLQKLLAGKPLADRTLVEIIRESDGAVFNNAAQVWNHTFYWSSMTPKGGGTPGGVVKSAIDSAFGSFDKFRRQFVESAVGMFGTGWTWLVQEPDGRVAIRSTEDAGTPIRDGVTTPLLTCDVWEHAYYLDYRHERPRYVETFLDRLANWAFVAENLSPARARRTA
jgi:Fe-Mn family superoxide dismutase